jgi:hypothetical protein
MISNLNGDIMGKIRECNRLKKENKVLTSQLMSLLRKSLEVDEWKMKHALQFEKIGKETKELKVEKYKQTKVLKEKDVLDHKQKLQMIGFTAKTS